MISAPSLKSIVIGVFCPLVAPKASIAFGLKWMKPHWLTKVCAGKVALFSSIFFSVFFLDSTNSVTSIRCVDPFRYSRHVPVSRYWCRTLYPHSRRGRKVFECKKKLDFQFLKDSRLPHDPTAQFPLNAQRRLSENIGTAEIVFQPVNNRIRRCIPRLCLSVIACDRRWPVDRSRGNRGGLRRRRIRWILRRLWNSLNAEPSQIRIRVRIQRGVLSLVFVFVE